MAKCIRCDEQFVSIGNVICMECHDMDDDYPTYLKDMENTKKEDDNEGDATDEIIDYVDDTYDDPDDGYVGGYDAAWDGDYGSDYGDYDRDFFEG